MNKDFTRRRVLRGMLGGGAVTLGLPFLDCMLNTNGTALAGGRPLPIRFGTWNWGLGMNPQRWVPAKTGADYELTPELKYIEKHKGQVSVLSGFDVPLDGKPNSAHYTGNIGFRMGATPAQPYGFRMPARIEAIEGGKGRDELKRQIVTTVDTTVAGWLRPGSADVPTTLT